MLLQTILEGLGLTTKEKINRNALRFKAICIRSQTVKKVFRQME